MSDGASDAWYEERNKEWDLPLNMVKPNIPASTRQVAGTHYKDMGVEPWDVIDTWPLDQRIGAYRHGVLKYLMRMGTKDEQLQEIKKAHHYLEKLIEVLEQPNKKETNGTHVD